MTKVQEEFEPNDNTNIVDISKGSYDVEEIEEDKQLRCSSGEINLVPNVKGEEFVPDLGKKFESIEKAYNFYNFYAILAGFSVRKHSTTKDPKEGFIKTQVFTCSKEGERKKRKDQPSKGVIAQYAKTRCGCRALMKVKRTPECEYVVMRFVDGHNHALHTPRKVNTDITMAMDLRKSMHLRYNELCFWSNPISRIGSMSEYSYDYALKGLQKLHGDLILIGKGESEKIVKERVGNSEDVEFESEDVELIRDLNVVRSKGSEKRYKSKRKLLISKKTKVGDKQKIMVMHCEENEGSKAMITCHNCKGHGHDSWNCSFLNKKEVGKLNISK